MAVEPRGPADGTPQPLLPLPEGFLPPNCPLSPHDWRALASQWLSVARADEVAAKPRPVTLLALKLVVYRVQEGVRVARDMCPHRGLPLSTGRIDGDQLVCAYHGLRFDADGHCRQIPDKLSPGPAQGFALTVFPALEHHGLVWTCLAPELR